MKKKQNPAGIASVSEQIIFVQSFYLFAFGLAGVMATSSVVAGFDALRDVHSAVAIVTDAGIMTEKGEVSVESVRGIIDNFELIAICAVSFGATILVATFVRGYDRYKTNKQQYHNRVVFAKRKRG